MKNRYLVLFTAVSVGACALTASAQDQGAQTQAPAARQTTPDLRGAASATAAGGQQESPHAEDIRRVLARVTEEAVKGNVKQVADNFATASQDQFNRRGRDANLTGPDARASTDDNKDAAKDEMKAMDDKLKETSRQLADAWQAKYGHGFSIDRKNEAMVYGGETFRILKGDVGTQGAQTAGSRVGASGAGLDSSTKSGAATTGDQASGRDATGTARLGDTTVTGSANVDGDAASTDDKKNDRSLRDRLTGRDNADAAADASSRMATVVVQASHGAPELQLTMINEGTFGNRWHIQPQAGMDYKSLSQNLQKHLQMVLDMKDQWPQDENEAYRAVSHHVLMAIAMPTGSQAGGQQNPNAAQPAGYSPDQQRQPSQPSDDQSSQQQAQPSQSSSEQAPTAPNR
jgi:hypothetical protein